jgi:hypothetical protein
MNTWRMLCPKGKWWKFWDCSSGFVGGCIMAAVVYGVMLLLGLV